MISFYPGPSQVYNEIPAYIKDAYKGGYLSINHRSDEFMELSSSTINLLRKKLFIPEEYMIFYTSSATECWEIIAQSLIDKTSYHFYNGAFGAKWFDYTKKLHSNCIGCQFDMESELKITDMDLSSDGGMICLTQNETSNGTQISNKRMSKIRKAYPKHLIAVDATSSMAGVNLDFNNADVWYASVQKCFGLPAGMGLLICSPAAIEKAQQINERKHYNSLLFMIDKMRKYQTTFTPNVLNIYLLNRVMQKSKSVDLVEKKLKRRFSDYHKLFSQFNEFEFLIKNKNTQSLTVLPIVGNPKKILKIKNEAKKQGLVLGNGYGEYKNNTFRIANFPAIRKGEIKSLHGFFEEHIS